MTSDCDADIKDENQVELTQSVELTRKEERRDRPRSGLRFFVLQFHSWYR